METAFFRGFVMLLALTGFGASHISSQKSFKAPARPNAIVCTPSDPNNCGLHPA